MSRRDKRADVEPARGDKPTPGGTTGGDLRATLGILVALGIALVGIDRKVATLRDEVNALDIRSTHLLGRVGGAAMDAGAVLGEGVQAPRLEHVAGYVLTAHGDEHARMTIDDLAAHLLDVHGLDPATAVEGWAQLHALHDVCQAADGPPASVVPLVTST